MNLWTKFLLFIPFWLFFLVIFYGIVFIIYPSSLTGSRADFNNLFSVNQGFLLLSQVAVFLGTFSAVIFVTRVLAKQELFFLTKMLRPVGLLQGMTIGLLGIFSVLLILSLSTKVVIKFNGIPNEFLIYLVVFFLVAVTEETLSRGFIFANLYAHSNRYLGFFLSSLIFSLLHAFNSSFNWISMLNIFLVGIFLCQLYIRGMSLAIPIGFHFAWNMFQGPVFGFSVSGFSASGIFSFAKSSGDKFSFEGFGLEGSVISTIVLGLFIVADILYGARKNKSEKPVVAGSGI